MFVFPRQVVRSFIVAKMDEKIAKNVAPVVARVVGMAEEQRKGLRSDEKLTPLSNVPIPLDIAEGSFDPSNP